MYAQVHHRPHSRRICLPGSENSDVCRQNQSRLCTLRATAFDRPLTDLIAVASRIVTVFFALHKAKDSVASERFHSPRLVKLEAVEVAFIKIKHGSPLHRLDKWLAREVGHVGRERHFRLAIDAIAVVRLLAIPISLKSLPASFATSLQSSL